MVTLQGAAHITQMTSVAAEKVCTGSKGNSPGAKAQPILNHVTARLKSCPDTKQEFFRSLPGRSRIVCASPSGGRSRC
jgi:hypothetical protein